MVPIALAGASGSPAAAGATAAGKVWVTAIWVSHTVEGTRRLRSASWVDQWTSLAWIRSRLPWASASWAASRGHLGVLRGLGRQLDAVGLGRLELALGRGDRLRGLPPAGADAHDGEGHERGQAALDAAQPAAAARSRAAGG